MKQNQKNEETQTKIYKQKIQNYLNHQKRDPRMKDMTNEKILTKMFLDSLMIEDNQQYNTRIFDVIKESIWSYQIKKQILNKIINKNDKIQSIVSSMLLILDGYFNFKSKKINLIYLKVPYVLRYQSFFLLQSTENFSVLFEVGLHKQYNDTKQQYCYFDIFQKITLIEIFFYQKGQEITDAIQEYQINNSKDFYRMALDQIECVSVPLTGINAKQQSYLFQVQNKGWPESLYFQQSQNIIQWIPLKFKQLIENKQDFLFKGHFIKKSFYEKLSNQFHYENIGNQNKYKLIQFVDFESVGKILDLLQRSQQFKIKLSDQERQIVTTKNNALVIGRSGTGKTTSTVLRIFATEMLVKVRSKLLGQKRIQFLQDYQGKEVQIHSLFSTANKFLVQEVEKYYHKLERQAQDVINTHRESMTFNLDESFVSINESVITNYESDILDFVSLFPEEQCLCYQNRGIPQLDKEKLNEKSLQLTKFPGFLSTEQLLILLDKTSLNPFFSIEKINKYRQKHSNKIGFQDFNGINLDEWFPQNKNAQYQSSFSNNIQLKQDVILPEVDFMLFYLQFWPQVCGRGRNNFDNTALPSLIWTQIYSYIKGSQYSYIYPNRCLPFKLYKERVENYLSEAQMIEIYDCFLKYEIWKEKEQYIDQLDLINQLLINIEQNELIRFPIHYSYIDEVQDLPQAMIELFCKITEQGIIFCGDSAQSILKGVGFRFSDLQTIFKTSKKIGSNQLEKFQVYQLTKNFRSHNNILQLANCIIIILELLFPHSLDHLQKEISNLKGPKPVIISKNDPSLIFNYLNQDCDAEEQCEIEFGYNQVLIVKNEEAKETLPQYFKTARVLTTYQTKGLEFDDVILYNCFSSDPIPEQQWAFLSCLDVDESYLDKQVFEASITKFEEQNNQYDIQLTEDGKQVVQKKITLNQRYDKKKTNDYSTLCNELKMLYVCVTRAKKRVIIYDDDPSQRYHIERILKQYKVCDFVSNIDQIYQITQKNKQVIDKPQDKFQQETQQSQSKILNDEERQIWESQGQLMFQKKLYDEAKKCFKRCKNKRMAELSKAFLFASKGSQKLANYKSYKFQFKKKGTLDLKKKMDELESQLKQDFQKAIKSFLNPQINDLQQAANCYYSCRMYEESVILFLHIKLYPQAAKSARKQKQIWLAILIYYNLGYHMNILKVLTENNQNQGYQYGFFKYDFLKECQNFGLLKKDEVKYHLLNQLQDSQQNVFHLLVQKQDNIGNTKVEINDFLQISISKKILDQVPIKDLFGNEIDKILKSQIYIDNDLEEMIYEEFKIFWELYYEIIDSKMIINIHSKQEISKIIDSKQQIYKNESLKQFFIEVLEQLNLHQVIITLYPEKQLFYQHFDPKKQKPQESEIVNKQDHICQFYDQMSILQALFLDEYEILRKSIQPENEDQKLLYKELYNLLLKKEELLAIKDENLFLIKSYYLLNYYSQKYLDDRKKYKTFEEYLRKFVNINFPAEFKLFCQFHLKINNNLELNEEDIQKLFNLKNQKEQFMIILHFFHNHYWKFQEKFIKNFNFQQLLFLGKFLIMIVHLFKIDYEDNQYNQDVFSSICSIFGAYHSKSKLLNLFGSSMTFYFMIDDTQGVTLIENFEIEQKIQNSFTQKINKLPILQIIFNNMIQKQDQINNNQQQYLMSNPTLISDLVFIINNVCHQIKNNVIPKKKHIFNLIQAISILDSLKIQIPKCMIDIIEEQYKFLFNLITFQTLCKNQISIKSLQHWVNFHLKINQFDNYHPKTLKNEINQVILILILLYNVDLIFIKDIDDISEINLKYLAINNKYYIDISNKETQKTVDKKENEQQLQEIKDTEQKQDLNQNQCQELQDQSQIKNSEINQEGEKNVQCLEKIIQVETQPTQEQQQENYGFQQEIDFIIFDEQKQLLEYLISIYYCDDNQINVDFNFKVEDLDDLLLNIYKILYKYMKNGQNTEIQTFIHQILILLNQNLLLLSSKEDQYKQIIENIVQIINEFDNNDMECEISQESFIDENLSDKNFDQKQKQNINEPVEQKDEQNQMNDQQIETVGESIEQLQKQEEQSNQISQSNIIIEQSNSQNTQQEIQAQEKVNQNSQIIIQNKEEQKQNIIKRQPSILQNIRLQLEKRQIYQYKSDPIENLQLISQNYLNCNIYLYNFNQRNYICSHQHKINQIQLHFRIEDQSQLSYMNFRSKISSYPIGNKITNENLIRIDKLKKVLHKCILYSKKLDIQGVSYSIFKELVFLLQKVSDLEYEQEQKQMDVYQKLNEIENKLIEYKNKKQKNDQMTHQIQKILNEQ